MEHSLVVLVGSKLLSSHKILKDDLRFEPRFLTDDNDDETHGIRIEILRLWFRIS